MAQLSDFTDFEAQLSPGGEKDLFKHYENCKKKNGHEKFIHVNDFSLLHLPIGHCDMCLFLLIKTAAILTVRVATTYTSRNRSEKFPYYNIGGKSMMRTGSGRISSLYEYIDGIEHESGYRHVENIRECWCEKCQKTDTPSHTWWEFNVETAAHVVYDQYEADKTSVRLFYDTKYSPVISVNKPRVVYASETRDFSVLRFVTCDLLLGNKLKNVLDAFSKYWWLVWEKYQQMRDVCKLAFIVSHPHGVSKTISVDRWETNEHICDYYNKFSYQTCTCPGSSGATVYCLGFGGGWMFYQLVHQKHDEDTKLNVSGLGYVGDICYSCLQKKN